jgi:DNA polymerase IV
MLRSLFVDFNSYFASVEQQLNPALRGCPVGVVPVMADTSCCIAASYEAKAFGVKTGTGVAEARWRCPDITLILADHAKYVEIHHLAVAAVDRIAPVRQVLSIDEMECELTGRWCERERAIGLAHRIKQEIEHTVGECLRSSIGIAPNTLLGKLASDMQKPNGLTVIELQDLPERLYDLELSDITGIGPRMRERLRRCGIESMTQLYAAPRDLLRTAWGGVAGAEMYDKLRGQWYGPRQTVARSLGHSHVLPPELRYPEGALQVLNRLMQKAAMRLRKQQVFASGLQVFVRSSRRARAAGAPAGAERYVQLGETQDTGLLLHAMETLWFSGLHTVREPQAVGLQLCGLVPASQHTLDLFDTASALSLPGAEVPINLEHLQAQAANTVGLKQVVNAKAPRDRSKLMAALDGLNKAQGKNTVYFASAHQALDAAPMRIAFNRIPDLETER